jgi:plastocyanin
LKRVLPRLSLAIGLALPLMAIGLMPAAAQTAPPGNVSVTMSDSGFSPANVTVAVGGTVTWTNKGANVHSATTLGGAPIGVDTGGVAPGQTISQSFSLPGTYAYTSAVDCLNGSNTPGYPCTQGFSVIVSNTAAAPVASAAPVAPSPAASAAPAPAGQVANASVTITDTGMSPATINLALNGSVTFTNSGANVHTATTTGGVPTLVDTGGLASGQTFSASYTLPGTYTYTSATDCLNGNNTVGFNCGPYVVNVGTSTAATASSAPAPAAPAPFTPAGPVATPTVALSSGGFTVTLSESTGFTPQTLTIKAGQTVTWINNGSQVHTVTSNTGYFNTFDSGGLDKNQKFSYNFTVPGTFGYHSSTEPSYFFDSSATGCSCTVTSYQYNGTIVVQ